MIYSLKKEKWPLQSTPLYEFRLLKDKTIKMEVVDRYEILSYNNSRKNIVYRIPSTSGIRHVSANDLDRVKNSYYTSLCGDMLKAINAFEAHYLNKIEKAKMEVNKYTMSWNDIHKTKLDYLKTNKSKTLYDRIMKFEDEDEFTVFDADYDIEVYFYKPSDPKNPDEWDTAMLEFAKLLEICNSDEPDYDEITVNMSQLIMCNLEKLKKSNLFISADIDDIMDSMESILAGNVSSEWLTKFVNVLKEEGK